MAKSSVRRALGALTVAGLMLGPGGVRPRAQAVVVAVVVHPTNGEDRMTRGELCDILLGERRRWEDERLIQVLVPPAASPEWEVVVQAVCRTSAVGFRRRVASSRAFGRASRPPQVVDTPAEMKQRVAASDRAIGFVAAAQLDSTIKALTIDGHAPTDPEYPIQGSSKLPPR